MIFHDPLAGIHLPNTSQKMLKNHYFGDTHPSSEFSGVLCAIQHKLFQAISIYRDSGITCGIPIAVYFMNLENPETHEFLEISKTKLPWPDLPIVDLLTCMEVIQQIENPSVCVLAYDSA